MSPCQSSKAFTLKKLRLPWGRVSNRAIKVFIPYEVYRLLVMMFHASHVKEKKKSCSDPASSVQNTMECSTK